MISVGANAPLTIGASSGALQAQRGLTIGSWAAGMAPGNPTLAARAAQVVELLATRFRTDPGEVIRAIQHVSTVTGLPILQVAQQAVSRPVVPLAQWKAAIQRFGWQVSYIIRHPGQDLTNLTVSMAGFNGQARTPNYNAVM